MGVLPAVYAVGARLAGSKVARTVGAELLQEVTDAGKEWVKDQVVKAVFGTSNPPLPGNLSEVSDQAGQAATAAGAAASAADAAAQAASAAAASMGNLADQVAETRLWVEGLLDWAYNAQFEAYRWRYAGDNGADLLLQDVNAGLVALGGSDGATSTIYVKGAGFEGRDVAVQVFRPGFLASLQGEQPFLGRYMGQGGAEVLAADVAAGLVRGQGPVLEVRASAGSPWRLALNPAEFVIRDGGGTDHTWLTLILDLLNQINIKPRT